MHPPAAMHWARRKIDTLMDEQRYSADHELNKHAITQLAMNAGLVTPYTSFVATEVQPVRRIDEQLTQHQVANLIPRGNQMMSISMPQGAAGVDTLTVLGLLLGISGLALLRLSRSSSHCMRRQRFLQLLSAIILTAALITGAQAAWLSGKAWLAQQLLDTAWQTSRQQGSSEKPWQWADVNTVARLSIPAIDGSLIVLSDASGEALAFGPGLVAGDPLQAESSTLAIGGHRDTHLAFLENLPAGELIELDTIDGKTHRYRLTDKQVIDTRSQSLSISTDTPGLVLITCYPFNAAQTGGPLRLVARAVVAAQQEP